MLPLTHEFICKESTGNLKDVHMLKKETVDHSSCFHACEHLHRMNFPVSYIV